jgi:CO/xanthine dehydrogenase FAD-binding subunit
MMITTYHRPQTLEEALALLNQPNALPLGGGTLLSKMTTGSVSAVDLQALGLDSLRVKGNDLEIGATCVLQALCESEFCHAAFKTALKLEAPLNLRNAATAAGTLVASDGRSPFAASLLAMDAKVKIAGGQPAQSKEVGVGEYLLLKPKGLITQIILPLNVKFSFEYVSKTPSDKPLVCAAVSQWNSGRARLALGGYGKTPLLAMDGTETDGIETAARNAYHEAQDEWASAKYRMDMAAILARRCLA